MTPTWMERAIGLGLTAGLFGLVAWWPPGPAVFAGLLWLAAGSVWVLGWRLAAAPWVPLPPLEQVQASRAGFEHFVVAALAALVWTHDGTWLVIAAAAVCGWSGTVALLVRIETRRGVRP